MRYNILFNIVCFMMMAILVSSCGHRKSVVSSHGPKQLTLGEHAQYDNDENLIPVHENSVIFFSIPEEKYVKQEKDRSGNIYDVVDNLYYVMGETVNALKSLGIYVALTASQSFKFIYNNGNVEYFSRQDDNVGIIFFGNNRSPQVHYGSMDTANIMQTAGRYFNLAN